MISFKSLKIIFIIFILFIFLNSCGGKLPGADARKYDPDPKKRVAKKKIAISILKRSKKLSELKNLLKDFKMLEEDKDIIFLKKTL